MRHARVALLTSVGAAALLAVAACSSMVGDEAATAGSFGPDAGKGSSSGSDDRTSYPNGPVASGVVLLHAAAFPSFRLCFSNFPELPPQPEDAVMPEANVVGVEIGSVVRLEPMQAPGTITVIKEEAVRSAPGSSSPVTCRELLAPPEKRTKKTLTANSDYHVATAIDEPLGQGQVSVLAITGCGNQIFLDTIGLSSDACGPDWHPAYGNLTARVVDLGTTSSVATDESLPVQLFQMSQALDAFQGDAGTLSVSFGALDGGADASAQDVPPGALFAGGPQTTLDVDQTDPAFYGAWGFRVTAGLDGGTFTLDQSLADVQALSSPRELTTTYYTAGSNYALLLLGDPTHAPTYEDGGVNPRYNPRQAVHILAVPVIDPAKADAGADGGAGEDAGDTIL